MWAWIERFGATKWLSDEGINYFVEQLNKKNRDDVAFLGTQFASKYLQGETVEGEIKMWRFGRLKVRGWL